MDIDFFGDVSDDIFNDPSLLQYTQPTSTSNSTYNHSHTNAQNQNPNQRYSPNLSHLNLNNNTNGNNTSNTDSNSRKRKYNQLNTITNHYQYASNNTTTPSKRQRVDGYPQSTSNAINKTPNRFFQQNSTSNTQMTHTPHSYGQSNPSNTSNISNVDTSYGPNSYRQSNHSNHSNTSNTSNSTKFHNATNNFVDRAQSPSMINVPECSHKLPSVLRTVRKRTKNFGRKFWCCDQSPSCQAFLWDDDWKREQNIKRRREGINAHSILMNRKLTLCTELICVDPEPLVEVAIHPPEQVFVDVIKQCRNATWNPETRKWCIPLDQILTEFVHIPTFTLSLCTLKHSVLLRNQMKATKAKQYHLSTNIIPGDIVSTVNRWKKTKIKTEGDTRKSALDRLPKKLRESLYDFQKDGFHFGVKKGGRCLIADEMGLGKSIQAIAVGYYFRSDWPLLIITPSSLTLTWKMEILRWLHGDVHEYDINIIKSTKDPMIEYDQKKHRNKPIKNITILSYGLATRKQPELSDPGLFGMVICDESHALKNAKTQRCKAIIPVIQKNIKRAVLLSGTPTNNRPSELYTQIDALRPNEFMTYKKYTVRYCEGKNGKFGWEARGAMHLKELHAMISHRVMIRREKKEVLTELPDKLRTVINIECDKSLSKKLAKKMEKHNDIMDELSECMNTHQYDGYSQEEKEEIIEKKKKPMLALYSLTGQSKIPKIIEYVTELLDSGLKILVFAHHLEVMDKIEESVQKMKGKEKPGYIRIDGGVAMSKRQALVTQFQEDKKVRIAVLSIEAAGTGFTLTAASTVVFAELTWSPMSLLQCEDRAHRISQTSVVNIVYLLGSGSLDDKLWPMIKRKMQVVSQTVSGKQEMMEVEEYKKQFVKSQKKEGVDGCDDIKGGDKGVEDGMRDKAGYKQKTITSMLPLKSLNPRDDSWIPS